MKVKTKLEYMHDPHKGVTTASITLPVGAYTRTFIGSAKRHPDDQNREIVGKTLAMSRALRKAADDLEREARRLIDTGPFTDLLRGLLEDPLMWWTR